MLIAAVACAGTLCAAGTARAEIVAPNAADGQLALNAKGTPSVAYVRGTRVVVATRAGNGKWRAVNAASTTSGATVKAFKIGAAGPVALVQSSDDRTLVVVRKRGSTRGRPFGLQTSARRWRSAGRAWRSTQRVSRPWPIRAGAAST